MNELESDVERAVCKWADANGIVHLKLNVQGHRHWPDRIFFIRGGRPALIEFKKQGEIPRKAQAHILKQLKGLRYQARWFDNKTAAIAWLGKIIRPRIGKTAVGGVNKSYANKNR